MKTKLFTLIMLLTIVACSAKAQDLIAEKVFDILYVKDEIHSTPYEFAYSNEKNLMAIRGEWWFAVTNLITKEILIKREPLGDFVFFNKGQNLVGRNKTKIIIYNTSIWQNYDSLTLNNQVVLEMALSNDQKKLCVLYKNGVNVYPDMKLVIWDIETKDILLERTINCELNYDLTNSAEVNFIRMDWNERLNLLSFEWSLYANPNSKPYRSGSCLTKVYSIDEDKMINEYMHAVNLVFNENSNTAYSNEEQYTSDAGYCKVKKILNFVSLDNGLLSTLSLEYIPTRMKKTGDYLLITQWQDTFGILAVNMKNQNIKKIKLPYSHYDVFLSEDNTKLIAQDYDSTDHIVLYGISNFTGINETIKDAFVYPNPTNNLLNLDLNNNPDCTIQIINESGKVVDGFSMINPEHLNYDTSRLPKGMYIMQINSSADSKSYKFIKE